MPIIVNRKKKKMNTLKSKGKFNKRASSEELKKKKEEHKKYEYEN